VAGENPVERKLRTVESRSCERGGDERAVVKEQKKAPEFGQFKGASQERGGKGLASLISSTNG